MAYDLAKIIKDIQERGFELTKAELKQRQALAARQSAANHALIDAVEALNSTMQEAWRRVEQATAFYNNELVEVQQFIDAVHARTSLLESEGLPEPARMWVKEWRRQLPALTLDQPAALELPDALFVACHLDALSESATYWLPPLSP
jgi:hypothetical protein